mgnify:CR=1 FL=1
MDQKAFVCKAIEAKQELYDRIADQIWQYAEAGMKEYGPPSIWNSRPESWALQWRLGKPVFPRLLWRPMEAATR